MKNCLVTKLKDIVINDDLIKINELRISFKDIVYNGKNELNSSIRLILSVQSKTTLSIIKGDARFTKLDGSSIGESKTLTLNKVGESEILLTANSVFDISIDDKNAITALGSGDSNFVSSATGVPRFIPSILLDDIKYLNINANMFNLANYSYLKGDISVFKNYNALEVLTVSPLTSRYKDAYENQLNHQSEVYGDATFLLEKGLKTIDISRTKVTGDIAKADFSKITNPYFSYIHNSKIYGDISYINKPHYGLSLGTGNNDIDTNVQKECEYNIFGDIGLFYKNIEPKIVDSLNLKGINTLYGNLASISSQIIFISGIFGKSKYSYQKLLDNPRQYMLILEKVYLGDYCDDYLIDMSNLQKHPDIEKYPWYGAISIEGKVTSKSENAIELLQEKGITVVIKNIEL